MQAPRWHNVEVVIPINTDTHIHAMNGIANRRSRPLSVDEALQYSPFTTSIAAGHDRIPVPQVGQASSHVSLTTPAERKTIRRGLEEFERNSTKRHNGFTPMQEVGQKVDKLLDGEALSEFKFKISSSSRPRQLPATTRPSNAFVPQLSSFASMILDSSDIAYKALSPSTPSPKASQAPPLPTPALSSSPKGAGTARNSFAFGQNQLTPVSQTLSPSRSKPLVVIPPLPSGSQREDYKTIPDSPKRRKLDNDEQSDRVALHVRAQKEEADALLMRFQDLLLEIFEAQDQLEPDSANITSELDNNFFEFIEDVEGSNVLLTTKIHSKLQNAIKKLVVCRRFNDVSADDIKRLQKLCEPSISATQTVNLGVDGDSEDEVERWQIRLGYADNGVTAACTVIWTILGSLQDKELCPEDAIQCLPNILNNVFENCLIPVVEARSEGRSSELFRIASDSKAALARLLGQGKKLLDLVATLCVKMEGAEGAINAMENLSSKLLFAENSYNEKESVLGFQPFEMVRRTAMEALAKIFARFPDQRSYILDEILVSLEKLPQKNRAARQFKLIDGKNIQLLTALVMQLVQTTATESPQYTKSGKSTRRNTSLTNGSRRDDESEEDEESVTITQGTMQSNDVLKSVCFALNEKTTNLQSNSLQSAKHIIAYLVQRAMTSTKTDKEGNQPYRNLLDLFTQDLLSVLRSPDWPASELLLYILALHLLQISQNAESTGSAKNMALELLGWMGSAISDLRVAVPRMLSTLHDNESHDMVELERFADDHIRGSMRAEDVVAAEGPYRMALEYLHKRAINDWQLNSAQRFYLLQWSKAVCTTFAFNEMNQNETNIDPEMEQLAQLLNNMHGDPTWLDDASRFGSITTAQGRLAYSLTVLNMNFCKLFDHVLQVILNSITSDQTKIRSRSLKSVISMLEIDPSLLDRDPTIIRAIFRCASDQSPMVRDSALSLIAKCMSLKPTLEEEACKVILRCANDPTVGVRKRSIGLMKDIYLRDSRRELQAAISKSLLERASDFEDGVSSLARQTLKDLWISPLLPLMSSAEESARAQVAITEQTTLIVTTLSYGAEELALPVEAFFRRTMKESAKDLRPTTQLCKMIVANLFDRIINVPESKESPENNKTIQERTYRESLLLTLVALAKADAKFVVPEQLKALKPYVSNLSGSDDLLFFRSVVSIYRCVLPYLSSTQQSLLSEIQQDLFRTISKLPRIELNEVMACLWTIDGVLKNTERLVRLTVSALNNIHLAKVPRTGDKAFSRTTEQIKATNHLRGYIRIAGCAGKHWDLEKFPDAFRRAFPSWKGNSVAGLMVDLICPWTTVEYRESVRGVALESLGAICQSWPGQFNKVQLRKAFSKVFEEEESSEFQGIILRSFAEFFGIREGPIDATMDAENGDTDQDLGRLGGSLQASDRDQAAAFIAGHYLDSIVHVAMTRQDSHALTAIKVVASINRQGVRHPKETAGVLVALETSTNPEIVNAAYESHRMMHQQHETLFEKEYMRAVQETFIYQKNVVKDSAGATVRPFRSKLAPLFEIVTTSNAKYVKKFLGNLVSRTKFEVTALQVSDKIPEHVLFVRFVSQNLAYFEFGRMDELYHTVLQLESVVGKNGADIAQAIETKIHEVTSTTIAETQDDAIDELQATIQPDQHTDLSVLDPASLATLKPLIAAAMILTMLWEARVYLRRQYGIKEDVRRYTGKGGDAKELSKAPTKAHGVTGDRFWDNVSSVMLSLDSPDTMMKRSHEFMTLMNVDEEVKVAADDDETRDVHSASVDPDGGVGDESMGGTGSRPGKRKSTASVGGTPKKKRGRPSLKGRRQSSTNVDEEDDEWD